MLLCAFFLIKALTGIFFALRFFTSSKPTKPPAPVTKTLFVAVDKFSELASLIEIKNAQFYDKQEPDFGFLFGGLLDGSNE